MRLFNVAISVGFSAALIAAGLFYKGDLDQREPSQHHIQVFGLDRRQPEVVSSIAYALSPDWAADLVADAALGDAVGKVNLTGSTPEVRAAWIESAWHLDEELRSARDLLLEAIAARPGWPFHESLLGQVILAADQREYGPTEMKSAALWLRPLSNAARGAPVVPGIWQSLTAGYLQTWPALRRDDDFTTSRILANAFTDADFVRTTFAPTAALVGSDMAIRCLPL